MLCVRIALSWMMKSEKSSALASDRINPNMRNRSAFPLCPKGGTCFFWYLLPRRGKGLGEGGLMIFVVGFSVER